MIIIKNTFILLLILLFLSPVVLGKGKKPKKKPRVVYKRKTSLSFDGKSIDGDYKKPDGHYIIHRASTKFDDIINFDLRLKDKVRKSVGYLE